MKCPLCNAPTDIEETRTTSKGYVRRRECFNGHTFSTVEALLTEPKVKRTTAKRIELDAPVYRRSNDRND